MNVTELNELFAVHVMGLVRGVDFGEWPEHEWQKDKYGSEIDIFGMEADHHNGPLCLRCGYSYCHHCQTKPSKPCKKEAPDYTAKYMFSTIGSLLAEKIPSGNISITYPEMDGEFATVSLSTKNEIHTGAAVSIGLAFVVATLRWKGVKV